MKQFRSNNYRLIKLQYIKQPQKNRDKGSHGRYRRSLGCSIYEAENLLYIPALCPTVSFLHHFRLR